jgi:hypothetical protein
MIYDQEYLLFIISLQLLYQVWLNCNTVFSLFIHSFILAMGTMYDSKQWTREDVEGGSHGII